MCFKKQKEVPETVEEKKTLEGEELKDVTGGFGNFPTVKDSDYGEPDPENPENPGIGGRV